MRAVIEAERRTDHYEISTFVVEGESWEDLTHRLAEQIYVIEKEGWKIGVTKDWITKERRLAIYFEE